MRISKGYYLFGGIALFIILINLVVFFFSPEEVVKKVGIENVYLVAFIIASVGGLSTLTGAVVLTSIATFSAGGANPLLLALSAGAGIFLSDTIFYFLVQYGRKAIPKTWEKALEKARMWIVKHPDWMVLLFSYLYVSFTPFPNDLLMIALVIGCYPYRKIVGPLVAGSLTVAFLTAYLGRSLLE